MAIIAEDAAVADSPPRRGLRAIYGRLARFLRRQMPTGLFARSLIIIIAPIVLLQAVVAFVFMERHWEEVTRRLSIAVVRDISAVIDIIDTYPQDAEFTELERIASDRLRLRLDVLPPEPLPAPVPRPFVAFLDIVLSDEISRLIDRPYWVDTTSSPSSVEIRIRLPEHVLRIFAPRNAVYASNSSLFIMWMVGASLVLLAISISFLRNQIRPILTLAAAADDFGKGRPVRPFKVRGAREVRQAALAFASMRSRIERMIDQRTTMLAGVSHDLRTVLTRFRLQLALIEETPETEALTTDVDDMNRMLEGYLAFARGDAGERSERIDVAHLIESVARENESPDRPIPARFDGDPVALVRPVGFKRCLVNLVQNARRHASRVAVESEHKDGCLIVHVDDDGLGIPLDQREAVFRPFYRLDEARNLDQSGTGLGLAIARDVVRLHGGDIDLSTSPMGGLRATVKIPA